MSEHASLTTDDLDFELPFDLIAQHPAEERGGSRLLVAGPGTGEPVHIGRFDVTFLEQLRPDDLVVANDSRVIDARIPIVRDTGGRGELLVLAPTADQPDTADVSTWTAMARPARKLHEDEIVLTQAGGARVRCVRRLDPQTWIVELPASIDEAPDWLRAHGELPLPPYISERGQDPARYQTVHAREDGSVAAPTAGLHFDGALWAAVRARVHDVAHVTLHVGAGTFLPVSEGPLDAHRMHSERYSVPAATDVAVRDALAAGRRVVAIGTTTTRVLEHAYADLDDPRPHGETQLLIAPGHRWACVGALLTNFHLPKSTLLALVMAFHGQDLTRTLYERAVAERMRFFSFGDAMFLPGPPR